MPPRKRVAETAPESERPTKRQTRSSGRATPTTSARPATKTRRAQPTIRKRVAETESDPEDIQTEANEVLASAAKPRMRTKSKAQTTNESLLADETNLVRESAVKPEPKPRRGRPPKKKHVEEHQGELYSLNK